MSKADITRSHIIKQAAEVFNQYGYAGTSMSDLMQATGLKKGGIYNHFGSKDELAIAAFDYSVNLLQRRYLKALRGHRPSTEKLIVMVDTFCQSMHEPTMKGGCPIMNTAIDSNHAHEALKKRAQFAMDSWRVLIKKLVERGRKLGKIAATVDSDAAATIIIATLEGAVMMNQLYEDPTHLNRAQNHINDYILSLRVPP